MNEIINKVNSSSKPVVLVIFGITGDLIKTYVLASVYELFLNKKFENGSKILCMIRRDWNNNDLREYLKSIMIKANYPNKDKYQEFLNLFEVSIGNFNEEDKFKVLNNKIKEYEDSLSLLVEKIYYLAISPEHFKDVIKNIGETGKEIFKEDSFEEIKLIVEKPFGLDLNDAVELDNLIAKYFKDEQIFRVDHYLAKYALRYLENISFEKEFGENFKLENAKKISIRMLENLGVEGRVSFYDKIGALRDTGQNHLLEVFATLLTTQSRITNLGYVENRNEGIKSLEILNNDNMPEKAKRKQAEEYLNIKGVDKNSNTETYFKIITTSKYFKDHEIEVELEGGKYQKETLFSIEIQYEGYLLIMKLKPTKIIQLWTTEDKCTLVKEVKIPEDGTHTEYYNIFSEVCEGNSKYFVSKAEVISEWEFVHPIIKYWKENSINGKRNKSKLIWNLLIVGYILILVLCVVVALQMRKQ